MAQATGQIPSVKPFNPSHALEPNPFEQSFCSKPSTSSSPVDSILSSAGGPSTAPTSVSSQRSKDVALGQNENMTPISERGSPLVGIGETAQILTGKSSIGGESNNPTGMARSKNLSGAGKSDSGITNQTDSLSPNSRNNLTGGSGVGGSSGNGGMQSATTPKPLLPGVASMASPGSIGSYGWNSSLASSLRTGPLSPAMLAGPHSAGSTGGGHQHSHSAGGFDISSFRTGFTPDLSNYKTGLTPLGSSASNIPPPSPSTAALIALMNSGGNGSSSPLGGASVSTMTPNTLAALASHHQNNLSPQGHHNHHHHHHHHHGGSSYFGREHSGTFDLAFGRSLSEKKVSRLRTSSGREMTIEDEEGADDSARRDQEREADSLINTDGGLEVVKVKTEEGSTPTTTTVEGFRSNEQGSRRGSDNKSQQSSNSRPTTSNTRVENETSDGLHLLHRAAHDGSSSSRPTSSHYHPLQQQQRHRFQPLPNAPPLPPQSSSSSRLLPPHGSSIYSSTAPSAPHSSSSSSSNKRRNLDPEQEDPSAASSSSAQAQTTTSKGKASKKQKTSSRGKSSEKDSHALNVNAGAIHGGIGSSRFEEIGATTRASMPPSETDSIDLDDLDRPDGKIGKGKKKAKGAAVEEPQSEEAKRREFLERNRQAALKCRQRKKAWVQDLQSRNSQLEIENETLQHTLAVMKQEMESLRMQLLSRDNANYNSSGGGVGGGNSDNNHRGGKVVEERMVGQPAQPPPSDLASGMVGNMATGIPLHSYRQQQHQHQHQNNPSMQLPLPNVNQHPSLHHQLQQQQQHPSGIAQLQRR